MSFCGFSHRSLRLTSYAQKRMLFTNGFLRFLHRSFAFTFLRPEAMCFYKAGYKKFAGRFSFLKKEAIRFFHFFL